MRPECARVAEAIDEGVAESAWPSALATHGAACAECQTRVRLARRIDAALAEWPVMAPPPQFASRVAAAARREAWAQDVVVDWGFNLAVAGCVTLILSGALAGLWMMSAVAPVTESTRVAADILAVAVERARGQASVAVTAMALLVTAVGGWWWAEQQQSE